MVGRSRDPVARTRFWALVRSGLSSVEASEALGYRRWWGWRLMQDAGGVNPISLTEPQGRYLRFDEREEIMRLDAAGQGVRAIARAIGRDASTVSRELKRGRAWRAGYRASIGQHQGDQSRRRPRSAKLATNLRLRAEVQDRLLRDESPEQIAGRLKIDFPDDPEMRVSHETIYQSLYVQSRGGLKRERACQVFCVRPVRGGG